MGDRQTDITSGRIFAQGGVLYDSKMSAQNERASVSISVIGRSFIIV